MCIQKKKKTCPNFDKKSVQTVNIDIEIKEFEKKLADWYELEIYISEATASQKDRSGDF